LFFFNSTLLFSIQPYFNNGREIIELQINTTKQYIVYTDKQYIQPLLQNAETIMTGTNTVPPGKLRIFDYKVTE